MTTENTVTEVELTPTQIAENFVKENTTSVIIEEFVNHYNKIENLKAKLQYQEQETRNQRSRWASMSQTIEEFLFEHIKDEQVSIDDLKQLADDLEIELTKEVEVTFTVEVTATVTVPLDFNAEDIEESDFDIRVNYEGSHDNVECDDIEWNTNDFTSDDK
jgi:hypothetical protein